MKTCGAKYFMILEIEITLMHMWLRPRHTSTNELQFPEKIIRFALWIWLKFCIGIIKHRKRKIFKHIYKNSRERKINHGQTYFNCLGLSKLSCIKFICYKRITKKKKKKKGNDDKVTRTIPCEYMKNRKYYKQKKNRNGEARKAMKRLVWSSDIRNPIFFIFSPTLFIVKYYKWNKIWYIK